jgi:cell division protein FtsN
MPAETVRDGKDPEITLGTMTVLGIFFGLAVLCAGFFGFGYSVGSKRAAAVTAAPSNVPQSVSGLPVCKPAPGSMVGPAAATASAPPSPATQPAAASTPSPAASSEKPAAATPVRFVGKPIVSADGKVVGDPVAVEPPAPSKPAHPAVAVAGPIAISATQVIVQVAALSHASDAQTLVAALRNKGYDVSVHSSGLDNLLHVQIGPFASKKEAEAMQDRLKNDGFNAILK